MGIREDRAPDVGHTQVALTDVDPTQPTDAVTLDADPFVTRVTAGFRSGGWSSRTVETTKSSAFLQVLNRLTSFGTPMVCRCASVHVVCTPSWTDSVKRFEYHN